jgi:hypothetical protein
MHRLRHRRRIVLRAKMSVPMASYGPCCTFAPPTPLPTHGVGAASGTFIGWISKAFSLQYGSDYML